MLAWTLTPKLVPPAARNRRYGSRGERLLARTGWQSGLGFTLASTRATVAPAPACRELGRPRHRRPARQPLPGAHPFRLRKEPPQGNCERKPSGSGADQEDRQPGYSPDHQVGEGASSLRLQHAKVRQHPGARLADPDHRERGVHGVTPDNPARRRPRPRWVGGSPPERTAPGLGRDNPSAGTTGGGYPGV